VLVRGQDVRNQPPERLRRSIGYVIQEGGLFPHLSVAANVATVPRLLRWPTDRVRNRVAEVLDLVGLPEASFGRRRPAELSGGQRQRVGVARALAGDPDLLLMDEPFGALDPGTRETIQEEFQALNRRLRKTVVLVTHDVVEAGRLADQIVVLDHGRVLQQGTLCDLLLRPASERIRAFLGSRAQWLALEMLRLREVISDFPATSAAADWLRLSADLPLGQALMALANVQGDATVVVGDGTARACSAGSLRSRILSDLKVVDGTCGGPSPPGTRQTEPPPQEATGK
jgi:osmoprotectant transport system ATP-binding protein